MNKQTRMKSESVWHRHLKNQLFKEQHFENKFLMKCKLEIKATQFLFHFIKKTSLI